ncbi:MAG TPA: hypothetical protein VK104_03410 [Burkholderiaceae bacterium]|nr:hypothetical protein [Burkholderiaceae bacterium]
MIAWSSGATKPESPHQRLKPNTSVRHVCARNNNALKFNIGCPNILGAQSRLCFPGYPPGFLRLIILPLAAPQACVARASVSIASVWQVQAFTLLLTEAGLAGKVLGRMGSVNPAASWYQAGSGINPGWQPTSRPQQ